MSTCPEHDDLESARDALRADDDLAAKLRKAARSRAADPACAVVSSPSPLPSPHVIPGYTIQEEISRGGMGVVYKAVQESTRRTVALKVMLEGPFASAAARQRFQREIELAASLDHPGIVAIFDSGAHEGRAYFAMQYVEGAPLDRWIADCRLRIADLIRLFVGICDAVNYAHQRGVIHRDLKPANILVVDVGAVSDRDSRDSPRPSRSETAPTAQPKVLDFGLARVAEDPSSIRNPQSAIRNPTVTGLVLGTVPYLSPEQVCGSANDFDVRTDVYSLGVILFEMLTGQFPYDVSESLPRTLRNIAEAEPRSPARLTRGRPPGRRIDRELDAIVLKALAKERRRRYQTVGELQRDLERYLAGEAVEARRDSGLYVLRKALRRYRAYVAAASLAFAAVCAVTIVSVRMNLQMRELARTHARAAALEAELAFGQGRYAEALAKAEQSLQHDDNLGESQLLRANSLLRLDRRDEAIGYLEAVLQRDAQSWAAHYALAAIDTDAERARWHRERVLALRPDTAEACYTSSLVPDEAEALSWLSRALERNPLHYESQVRRARLEIRAGRWDEALRDADAAVRSRPADYQGWWLKGEALLHQRDYAAALSMFDEALRLKQHPVIHYSRATAHRRTQRYREAIDDYTQALKIAGPGGGNPWVPYQRATLHWIVGDPEAALRDYDLFARFHPEPLWSDLRRFLILKELHRDAQAESRLREACGRLDPSDWLARVMRFLLAPGRTADASPEVLLASAADDGQRCEACFYIAERFWHEGDRSAARRFYQACLDTGVDRYLIPGEVTPSNEYDLAEWRMVTLAAP